MDITVIQIRKIQEHLNRHWKDKYIDFLFCQRDYPHDHFGLENC